MTIFVFENEEVFERVLSNQFVPRDSYIPYTNYRILDGMLYTTHRTYKIIKRVSANYILVEHIWYGV